VYDPLTDAQQITDELMNGAMGALAMGGEQAPWHVYAEARVKRNGWLTWIRRNIANFIDYARTPPGMPDIEAMALLNRPLQGNAPLESRILDLGPIPHGILLKLKCMLCGDDLFSLIFRGVDDGGDLNGDTNLQIWMSIESTVQMHMFFHHGCTVNGCTVNGGSVCPIHPGTVEIGLAGLQDEEEQGDEFTRLMVACAKSIAQMNGGFGLVRGPHGWTPQGDPMRLVMPVPCSIDGETGEWKEEVLDSARAEDMQRCKKRASIIRQLHQAFICPDTQRMFCAKYLNVRCLFPTMSIMLRAWIFFQGLWLVPEGKPALSEDAMRHIIMQYMRLVFKEIAADLRITPLVVGTLLSIECLRPTHAEQQYRVMTEPRLFANWLGIELQKQQMAMRFVNLPNVVSWQRITYSRR
jgi:hypothetical protein